jgi:hypothetical protein
LDLVRGLEGEDPDLLVSPVILVRHLLGRS